MILGIISIAVSLLEYLAYVYGKIPSIIASRLWLGLAGVYLGSSVFIIGRQIFKDLKNKIILPVLALLIVSIVAFWGVGSYSWLIDSEAAIQVTTGIKNFQKPDWGYTANGFISYPSRQYLILAMPSIVSGRNLINLRIGYVILFCLGVGLFYIALRITHSDSGNLTALAIISLLGSPVLLVFLKHFEQSILPVSLTMQAMGWLMYTVKQPRLISGLNLIWIGGMLATSYTPGLGSWVLLLAVLAWITFQKIIYHKWNQLLFFISCLIPISVVGIMSFTTRQDFLQRAVRIGGEFNSSIGEMMNIFKITFQSSHSSLFGPIIITLFLVYILGAAIGFWGYKHWAIGIWAIGIYAAAGFMKGYASPPAAASIHRALIILPITIFGIAHVVASRRLHLHPSLVLLIMGLFIGQSVYTYTNYHDRKESQARTALIKDIANRANEYNFIGEQIFNVEIYSKIHELTSLPDSANYFFPKSQISYNLGNCGAVLLTHPKIVYADNDAPCLNALSSYNVNKVLGVSNITDPAIINLIRLEYIP